MDFWRLYRLILSKRWLIAAIVLLTGLVVFAGTVFRTLNKEYEAVTLMQPQDPAEAQREADLQGVTPDSANRSQTQDRLTNIAELISTLRSSNDLTNRATKLLKMNGEERHKEVARILKKNGYFAQIDADVENQAKDAVKSGDLNAKKAPDWIIAQKTKAHDVLTDSLSLASDNSGMFGAAGVGVRDSDIKDRIDKIVTFESVESPFSTDQNLQIVNQIKIVAKSPRAAEAELYANMVGVAFLDFYTSQSSRAVNARIELIREKLGSAQKQYNQARDAVTRFRTSTNLDGSEAAPGMALTNVQQYSNTLNAAKQELVGATAKVTRLQSLLSGARQVSSVQLPPSENPQVRELERKVAELKIAFSKVEQSNFGPGSDVYIQSKAELDKAQAELKAARLVPFTASTANGNRQLLESQLDQALVQRDDLQNRVTELTTQLAAVKKVNGAIPWAAAKLNDLQGVADLRQDAVRRLEKALAVQELNIIEKGRTDIDIVSAAHSELIEVMSTGKRITIVIYGMSLALVFSILGIVAFDALDNAVKTAGDAQRLLDLSVIGQIPSHLSDLMRGPRVVALDPLSPAAESYRLLRTDLLFMSAERPFKSLLITPLRHSQGATTTAGNLAIALAQSGRRVILVDADLRRPKLHAVFNVSNNIGLSSVLSGQDDYTAALLQTDIQNLSIIPAGPPVMNPSELVGATVMGTLHRRLRDSVDFVIFDAPSPVACADAAILSSIVDATLLVLRAGQAPDGAAEQQVQSRLEKAHANVLGMILNDIEPDRLLSARHHTAYHPPLVSGNINGSGPYPIAALPGPKAELNGVSTEISEADIPTPQVKTDTENTESVPEKETDDDGNDDSHNNGNGSNGTSNGNGELPKAISKPRIQAMSTETNGVNAEAGATDATPRRTTRRTTQTPLALLIAVGASTAIGLLTLAISKGGN